MHMPSKLFFAMIVLLSISFCSFSGAATAQGSIPATLHAGCKKEIATYCKKVSPGAGRVVACLYSYGEKLSANCAFAMYDAFGQFETVMAALRHIAKRTACRSDIAEYCKGVPVGGGRIYHCIVKNKAMLTDGCRAALPHAEQLMRRAGFAE